MSAFVNRARIALCQIKVGADKLANIQHVKNTVGAAVSTSRDTEKPLDLVVLPEIWNSPYSNASFPVYAEIVPNIGQQPNKEESPSTALLCDLAREHNIWIVGGSVPERVIGEDGNTKLFNTSTIINSAGDIIGKHRKVHLFDIDIPGKMTFKESETLTAGNTVTVVDTPWGKLGVGICYDMRFPELALLMRQRGCRMIIYPGAFNMVTGPAHWELLQRSRALDTQCFVATCSPARDTSNSGGYVAYGHSSVVSPWGEVIATCEGDEATVITEMDFSVLDTTRQNIPCWHQKRHNLYEVVDKTN